VTLAELTNVDSSILVAVVFLSLAATVIVIRLRERRRNTGKKTELSLLERIEAMTNEEYEEWRAESRRQLEGNLKRRRPVDRGSQGQP
jgi:hypothetical protein